MQRYGFNRSCAAQACTPIRQRARARYAFVLVPALALILGACSPTPLTAVTPVAQDTPAPAATPAAQTLRIIVKFRSAVPYADAAFLQTLGQQVDARLTYLASVSADTHVYRMEPLDNQRPADVLQRLSRVPSVLYVEIDALARPS